MLALLAEFQMAALIASSSFQQLATIRYGNNNWTLSASFIKNVKSLSQHSIGYKNGLGAGFVVLPLVRWIWQFQ